MTETDAGSALDRSMIWAPLAFVAFLIAVCGLGASAVAEEPRYTVHPCDSTLALPEVRLPDLTTYKPEAVRKSIPPLSGGKAELIPAEGNKFLEESLQSKRRDDLSERQQTPQLRAIAVSNGIMSLEDVASQINDPTAVLLEGGVVTLRLPLLVQPGAALVVNGSITRELRLSTSRGAFVINAGSLYIVDALVTSWDETTGAATPLPDQKSFRPFIASHIRSHTVLLSSIFQELGYAAPTSYGISLSSEPERERGSVNDDWPTGVLVDNEFRGLLYGFYSYEARDVAIVGNRYRDCIKYGIDPHDRSTRLIIAHNEASGTVERHGIIGSRGVSDSFIFDNKAHHNAGSGIMLDRECTGNVVVGNQVYLNNQGIAVYESSDNIITGNVIAKNNRSGVRVRNSQKVSVFNNKCALNGDYAFEVSQKRLSDHEKRVDRGDTYTQKTTAVIAGSQLARNRGFLKSNGLTRLSLGSVSTITDVASISGLTGTPLPTSGSLSKLTIGGDLKALTDDLQALRETAPRCLAVEAAQGSPD